MSFSGTCVHVCALTLARVLGFPYYNYSIITIIHSILLVATYGENLPRHNHDPPSGGM